MGKSLINRSLGILAVVSLLLVFASASYAAPMTLTLTTSPGGVIPVPDAAGLWQFDGGTVSHGTTVIGSFARVKRVVNGGTDILNTAMLTITIFFFGSDPPESVTLQGSHSLATGEEKGSISGASPVLEGSVGITFQGPSNSLTFDVP